MTLPNSPAMMHATSGDKTMVRYMDCISILALKGIEIFDVDAAAFAEQHHQNREANSGLGRRDGQDEKDEYLPADVAAETRESHEIEIHRQQHEFDAHQQHDDVLAIQEHAGHRNGEQDAGQGEHVGEGNHSFFSEAILTMRTRSLARTATCCAIS